MSEKAKAQKGQAIQRKMYELQQKTVAAQRSIQQLEQKLHAPVLKKIRAIIVTISKSAGVDITYEKNAAGVIYVNKEKRFNKLSCESLQ